MKKFLIMGVAAAALAMPAAAQTVDAGTIINAAAQIYNATRGYNNNGYYNNGYYNNGYYVNPNVNNGYYNNYQYYDTTPSTYYNNGYYNNGYRVYPTNVRRNGYYIDNYGNRVYYRP